MKLSNQYASTQGDVVGPRPVVVPDDQPLCHYVRFEHLADLFKNKGFYAKQASLFKDKMEGRFNNADQARWDHDTRQRLKLAGASDFTIDKYLCLIDQHDLRTSRLFAYIVCFRADGQEHQRCWETYMEGQPGIMLKTTVGSLRNAIQEWVRFGPIEYLRRKQQSAIDARIPIFYVKERSKYAWEQEIRMCTYHVYAEDLQGHAVDIDPLSSLLMHLYGEDADLKSLELAFIHGVGPVPDMNPAGRIISFDLTTLCSEVVLSPSMSPSVESQVGELLASNGITAHIRRSKFDFTNL